MLRPISVDTAGNGNGYSALGAFLQCDSAVSPEASDITAVARRVFRFAEESQALYGEKKFAISQIILLFLECDVPNWDGEGAPAMSRQAVENAENFIRALPDGVPMPEISADPDGAISLDWFKTRHRMFSVSVGPGNRLAFAWLNGTDRGHGVSRFVGGVLPEKILQGIRQL